MTPQQLIAASRARRGAPPRSYSPHAPHPRQAEFLALDCFEALYGGAAGGGKSDALLMAALQYVHVPGYSALLLRRTYKDLALPEAIMDRSHTWLDGTDARWDDKGKCWTFPSGATLVFGYLDNERDKDRYQGAAFQFVGFDELTQFPERWYRYLHSRLRRPKGSTIPIRARAASNPGGIGHDWVHRRFVRADLDHDGRRFVPATLADNPSLDRDEYTRTLERLDPTVRAQLLHGVWVRDSGGLVYKFDEARNVTKVCPPLTRWILGIDYGFTDSTAFAVVGWREHDPCVYVVESFKQEGLTPSQAAEVTRDLQARYSFTRIVGDIGGLGKGYAEEARRRFHIPIEPAEKVNKRGYIDLLNGALCEGQLKLVARLNDGLQAEWLELPWNKDRSAPEDGFEDHIADALLYAWRASHAFVERPEELKPLTGTREAHEAEAKRMLEHRLATVAKQAGKKWWAR